MIDIDAQKIEAIIRHVAATEIMPRFRNLQHGDSREKNPNDFVTVADEAAERAFERLLAEALPGSLVVGEEAVARDKSVLDRFREDRPVWVIDPIDGTSNFMKGNETFGVLIALVRNGATQYGWAFDAPGNRMAWAKRGGGAWLDGKRIEIRNDKTDLSQMVGYGVSGSAGKYKSVASRFKKMVRLRCVLHEFMHFFTGDADFVMHVNELTPWDHAAVNLIAQEAGACSLIGDGAPYDPTFMGRASLITAPSRACWDKLHDVLNENSAPLTRRTH